MSEGAEDARGLRALLVRRVLLVVTVALALLDVLVGVTAHRLIHQQTDAMLLELAAAEAKLSLAESPARLHVHSSVVALPGWQRDAAIRHAMIFDLGCRVRAHTPELGHPEAPPEGWCVPERIQSARVDFATVGDLELRAASATAYGPGGEQLTFLVGVDHQHIDRATWLIILVSLIPSLLILAAVWLALGRVASSVTGDLERLGAACDALEITDAAPTQVPRELFEVSPDASREMRALSRTLAGLTARLEESLRTQSRFIAEAAHELRTPLTAIRGELEVTLRRERSPEEYRESIQLALDDVERLHRLSEDLLAAARAEEREVALGVTSPRDLVREAAHRAASSLEQAGLEVDASALEGAPDVLADDLLATRVLINLLDNAAQHARATRVTITAAREPGGGVSLLVCDDGRGVPDELLAHLFTPFARGDRRGHGLGLFIARRLMRQQRGDLALVADARPGHGACWRLTFRGADVA